MKAVRIRRLGDHEHKHKKRMKFLIKALGWERYRNEYEKEGERICVEAGAKLPFNPKIRPSSTLLPRYVDQPRPQRTSPREPRARWSGAPA
jgi:sulfite reductase beta subunit-like hemoprotein